MPCRQQTCKPLMTGLCMFIVLVLAACSKDKMEDFSGQSTQSLPDSHRTVGERNIIMCGDTISINDLTKLTETLAKVVQGIRSLEELEHWFRSQPCIESFKTTSYLIETEPPQKEYWVTFKMADGSTATKIIDIVLYPDHTFGLGGVYEQ